MDARQLMRATFQTDAQLKCTGCDPMVQRHMWRETLTLAAAALTSELAPANGQLPTAAAFEVRERPCTLFCKGFCPPSLVSNRPVVPWFPARQSGLVFGTSAHQGLTWPHC